MKKYSNLFGIHWLGKVMLPLFMPFGVATGCKVLQTLLDIVVRALELKLPQLFLHNNKPLSDHYLDDQCGVAQSQAIAWLQCVIYITVVTMIGLPFSITKIQFPSKKVILLGFELDVLSSTLALKASKALKYLKQVVYLSENIHKAFIQLMQQVVGRLRHAAVAIHGASALVRGMEYQTNLMISLNYGRKRCFTLSLEARHDLEFWKILLPHFNGIPFTYVIKRKEDISITMFSDAAGNPNLGFAAWDTLGRFFVLPWNQTLLRTTTLIDENNINELELMAFCFMILASKQQYKGLAIQIYCDNKSAVSWWIHKAPKFKIKHYKVISHLIRQTTLHCIHNRTFIWIDYIKTQKNKRADKLSRLIPHAIDTPQEGFPYIKFKYINIRRVVNKFVKIWKNKKWL